MEDLVIEAIDYGQKLGGSFVEVRILDDIWNSFYTENLKTSEVTTERKKGAGIRVYVKGTWGFTATPDLTRDGLKASVESAYRMANSFKKVEDADKDFTQKPVEDRIKVPRRIDFRDVSNEEKIFRIFQVEKRLKDASDKIVLTKINYDEAMRSLTVGNSLGTLVVQDACYAQVWASVVARDGGKLAVRRTRHGKRGGFEFLFSEEVEGLPYISKRAEDLLKAKPIKAGKYKMMFDGQMTGILAHEAFGHPCEADCMIGVGIDTGSVLAGTLGDKVGADSVTLVDDPTLPWNAFYYYDDEGTPSQRTVVIDKGVFKCPIHSLDSARVMQVPPTGHGRTPNFEERPVSSMTTTFIQPDPNGPSPKEMLEILKDGVYAIGEYHGYSGNITGNFQFRCQEAWVVENGNMKELCMGALVTGKTLGALNDITCIGRDFAPPASGHFPPGTRCDIGGPHVIIDNMIIGSEG